MSEDFLKKTQSSLPATEKKSQFKQLFWGGLIPIIAFTLIDEKYGPVWGTIAGLIFGLGEVAFEYHREKKVSLITGLSNFFILIMGLVTIWTQEGFWFKMQPAILLLIFALFLLFSSFRGKPFILALAEKQKQTFPEPLRPFMSGLNTRLGFFFLALTALSVWAALHWSTESWAILKGIGTPALLFLYMLVEILFFRLRMRNPSK